MSAAAAACLRLLLATGVAGAPAGAGSAGAAEAARAAAATDAARAAETAAGGRATDAPRVRLLVPTLADLTELAVLLRGELTAAGFRVEDRAVPAGPLAVWVAEARRDGVMAVVALDPAPAQAHVWLLPRAPAAAVPAAVIVSEPGPAGRAGVSAASRARTTLAVRIAERLRATVAPAVAMTGAASSAGTVRSAGAVAGSAGAPTRSTSFVAASPVTSARAAEVRGAPSAGVGVGRFPSPGLAALARPLPAERGEVSEARAGGAPSAPAHPLRFEGVLLAGRGLHPDAAALGLELALARRLGRHGLMRLGLTERGSPRHLSAPAGTARPFETALLATVGFVPRLRRAERLAPEIALGFGLQHTLLLGQGAAGFDGHSAGAVAAVVTARAGLAVALGQRTALLLAARVYRVLPQPVVVLDDVTASRAGPGFEAGLGLAFGFAD